MSETLYTLPHLLRVMARLRDPDGGCPWDLEQDFQSIVPSTLEECYELAAAIEQEDFEHVAEELGDVLFQVVFYAQLGAERGLFQFDEVVDTLTRKLVRRHPHVFADGQIEGRFEGERSIASVKHSWEAIKQQERQSRQLPAALDDVPNNLPALSRAQKLQKRAARVNFDWPETAPVLDKIQEEIAELQTAMAAGDRGGIEEEVGDLLFSCVNLARHLGADAETALRRSSSKFEHRFRHMESVANTQCRPLEELTEAEWEALWQGAKGDEARQR